MKIYNNKTIISYICIVAAILILMNIVGSSWSYRWDFTKNKIYTLSDSSKAVLDKIDDRLTMKVYFSDNLPGEYGNNRRYLQDILEEYAAYSDKYIHFEYFSTDDDEKMQEDARKSGIQPVRLTVLENDRQESKLVYMGMVFLYEDDSEIIPVIQTTTGLEYEITNKIKKLVDANEKTIAIAKFNNSNRTNQGISQILTQRYQLQDIYLTNPIPEDIGVLIMNGVTDSLDNNSLQYLKDYIESGGNILISQGRVMVGLNQQIRFFDGTNIQSNIFDILNEYGVIIEENLVLDKQNGKINIPQNIFITTQLDYPFFPMVTTFNNDVSIVNNLEIIQFHFSSEITIDSLANNVTPIMFSSNNSATMEGFYNLYPNTDESNTPIFNQLNEKKKILGVIIDTKKGGEIILLSELGFFADPDQTLAKVFAQRRQDNYTFIENSVDYLIGDEGLLELRSREITNRPLQELEDDVKARWKWINILLPSFLVVAFGGLRMRSEKNRAKVLEEIYG